MIEWIELKKEFEQNFAKIKLWLSEEFAKINSGRVNSNIFNHIKVDAYGQTLPLMQLANISSIDARQLLIKPYDHNLLKEVAKAIAESEYHVNPQINSDSIRVIFPPLTEQTRKESVKKAKIYLEQAKIKIRNIRQQIQAKYKKDNSISKDLVRYFEDELNLVTKNANKDVEQAFIKKEKDLMTL